MPSIPLDPAIVNSIDIPKLISEVKKRPLLYDNKNVNYSDRVGKVKAWYEVAAAVVKDWDLMDDEDRDNIERQVRGKWRHVRDYFVKDLKQQKGGSKNKKRKRYEHSKKLMFLLPVIRVRNNVNGRASINANHTTNDKYKVEEVMYEDSSVEPFEAQPPQMEPQPQHCESPREVIHSVDPLCEATLQMFENDPPAENPTSNQRNPSDETEDFDRMFLLSLLPALRQVPEGMKLQVKIEMQQALAAGMRANSNAARMSY